MMEASIRDQPNPFQTVIESLNAADISYAILRPSNPDNKGFQDLDILVDPRHRNRFVTVCMTCGFYKSRPKPTLKLKEIFYHYGNGLLLALDVHYSVVSKSLVYLDYRLLLERRVLREGVYCLSVEDQLLHLVFHCILDKRHIPIKYIGYFDLHSSDNYDQVYVKSHLEKFGLNSHFKLFLSRQQELLKNPSECSALRDEVRRSLQILNPGNFFRNLWKRACHRFEQIIGKRGVLIAVVGPDGVGKSTLTSRLQKRVKELRQSSTCVYMGPWGHSILPVSKLVRLIGAPGTLSRRLDIPLIPQLRWLVYLAVLGAEFLVRHVVRVIPACRSHSVVFSDRYFYDVGAGYKKLAVGECQGLRQLFCRLLFHPDLTIFLLASPNTVASRKDQLNDTEVAAFNRAYHVIAQRLDMVIVESNKQTEVVVESVLEDIWPLLFCSRSIGKQRLRVLVESSKMKHSRLSTQFQDIASSCNEIKKKGS